MFIRARVSLKDCVRNQYRDLANQLRRRVLTVGVESRSSCCEGMQRQPSITRQHNLPDVAGRGSYGKESHCSHNAPVLWV